MNQSMGAIYLIRHGQASFGAANYDQLSPLGEQQARVLGAALAPRVTPDVAVCGAMQRHRQTAQGCLEAMGRSPEWIEDAGFSEYDHVEIIGRYMSPEGWAAKLSAAPDRGRAFEGLFVEALQRWQSGAHDAEYQEPWTLFRERRLAALDRMVARLERGQSALVFTSGGVIATVVQQLMGFALERYPAFNWRLANAGVTKLVVGSGGVFLSTLNEHGHFEGERREMLTYR